MWQDVVFLVGSTLSVLFLYPTLRDATAQVPRATSVPSTLIGGLYAVTFYTLGMTFSALGSVAAFGMWSLIAALRAPPDSGRSSVLDTGRSRELFASRSRELFASRSRGLRLGLARYYRQLVVVLEGPDDHPVVLGPLR